MTKYSGMATRTYNGTTTLTWEVRDGVLVKFQADGDDLLSEFATWVIPPLSADPATWDLVVETSLFDYYVIRHPLEQSADLVEPDTVFDSTSPRSSAMPLQSIAQHHGLMALASIDTVTTPRVSATPVLPTLSTVRKQGYTKGRAEPVDLAEIDGFLIEVNAAYDFLVMRNAAAKDGLALQIRSAFRAMDTQIRLWNARMRPIYAPGTARPKDVTLTSEGRTAGPAAYPGYSNHQSGIALDLHTGMTIADRKAGRYSAIFIWLQEHAEKFGFYNTDIPKSHPEPWHWHHPAREFVAKKLAEDLMVKDYYIDLIQVGDTAKQALLRGSKAKTTYDKLIAYRRSVQAANSPLQVHKDNNASEKIGLSAQTAQYVADETQLESLTANRQPGFDATTTRPFIYNFQTGLWGDGEPV